MTDDNDDALTQASFAFQLNMLEKGYEQLQRQILHLDEILFKIKASAITVWVALIGWSFSAEKPEIIPLGMVVIIGFWLLEAMYKGSQSHYIDASKKLVAFINDASAVRQQFSQQRFSAGIIYPVTIQATELDKAIMLARGLISPTVATVYLFLGLANILVAISSGRI